jgi:hypothetical protein
MFLSYLDDIDIYLYVSTLIKKLLIKQLKDPEITRPRQIRILSYRFVNPSSHGITSLVV